MIKNKKLILPFLFLAWTIIFAHSIVPHHHHFDLGFVEKNHCHHEHHNGQEHDFIVSSEFDCCDHNTNEHTCHFHVEILTQVSIDNVFICTKENNLFNDITCIEAGYVNFYKEFISEEFPKTNYLRGPPALA